MEDVLCGVVSLTAARDVYGVVIAGNAVDHAATELLRASPRRVTTPFTLGSEREALETIWPPRMRAELALAVMQAPPGLRRHLIGSLQAKLNESRQPVTSEDLAAALRREGLASSQGSQTQ